MDDSSRYSRRARGFSGFGRVTTGSFSVEAAVQRPRFLTRKVFFFIGICLLTAVCRTPLASTDILATGFVISADGFILTNRHVVESCAEPIDVQFIGSGSRRGVIVATGKSLVLALLATGFRHAPYLRLRASESKASLPIRGEPVHTLGFIGGEFSPRGGLITETS